MSNRSGSGSSWGGIALIVVGGLFLAHNLGYIHVGDLWEFWPLILIAIGVRLVLNRRKSGDAPPDPPS